MEKHRQPAPIQQPPVNQNVAHHDAGGVTHVAGGMEMGLCLTGGVVAARCPKAELYGLPMLTSSFYGGLLSADWLASIMYGLDMVAKPLTHWPHPYDELIT